MDEKNTTTTPITSISKKKWTSVRNPYAKKPLQKQSLSSTNGHVNSGSNNKLPAAFAKSSLDATRKKEPSSSSSPTPNPYLAVPSRTLTNKSVAFSSVTTTAPDTSSTSTAATTTIPAAPPSSSRATPQSIHVGSNLPIASRLPSRTVSFTSAEILTISEASQVLLEYFAKSTEQDQQPSSKSIRSTGIVLYVDRVRHYLVLGDPVAPLKPCQSLITNKRNPRTTNTSSLVNSMTSPPPTTPSSNNVAKAVHESTSRNARDGKNSASERIKSTPHHKRIATTTPRSSSTTSSSSILFSGSKKRKLVTAPKPQYNSLLQSKRNILSKSTLSLSSKGSGLRVGLNRPSPFLKSTTSGIHYNGNSSTNVKRLIQGQIRNESSVLMVDISSFSLDDLDGCKVGDLAMILGEVVRVSPPTNTNSKANGEGSMCPSMEHVLEFWAKQVLQVNCRNDDAGGSTDGPFGVLKARIVRNANGTDINLYHQALKLRRQFLEEQIDGGLYVL